MFTNTFTSAPRRILALVVLLFVLRAVLAIVIVPPWQHPDEPQHFAFVHILAQQRHVDLSVRSDPDLEREILKSMSRHGWWSHYGELEPIPFPSDFMDPRITQHIWRVETSPPVYYLLGAAALGLSSPNGLEAEYYVLRWMALAFAIPTIMCIWAGMRHLFGVGVAAGSTLLVALHPQFVLMSTAVNPDVLVNLCGAVLWWQGARLLTKSSAAGSMAIMMCATVVGVLTKRVAAPLIVMLVIVPMLVAVRRPSAWRAAKPTIVALVGVMLIAGLLAILWLGDEAIRLRDYWAYLVTISWSDRVSDWAFFEQFTTMLFNSSWLQAGWLRYPAPAGWLLTVRLLTVSALAGCVIGLLRPGMRKWRVGLALAGVLVLIQVVGIYGGVYVNGFGAQGRYLFPIIGPFMVLFWVGIHSWWPRDTWPFVGAGLVSLMFVLDVVSWLRVLVPAYVR